MNCREFAELIPWREEGGLEAADAREVEQHMGACAACRSLAEELAESQAALRELAQEQVGQEVYGRLRARVLERVAERRRPLRWISAAAVCACALLLAVLWMAHRPAARVVVRRAVATPPVAAHEVRAPAPVPVRPVLPRRRAVRKSPRPLVTVAAAPAEPSDPVLVRVRTSRPDVVIYWILDPKGEAQ